MRIHVVLNWFDVIDCNTPSNAQQGECRSAALVNRPLRLDEHEQKWRKVCTRCDCWRVSFYVIRKGLSSLDPLMCRR